MATLEKPVPEEAECRLERRILVAAPTGRDTGVLCQITREAGFESLICAQPEELCRAIDEGAATAILAQEALSKEMCRALTETLSRLPEWSDFPLIVLAAPGSVQHEQGRWVHLFTSSAHVVVLERPVRKVTLVSTVQAAVQSRMRQYQVRDELLERRRTEEALRESETKYRRLFEGNIIGMVVADEEKGIFEANEPFLSMIGYTREEFEAGVFDWLTSTPPEHHRKDEEALRKLRGKSFFEPFQKEFVRKNGTRVPFLLGGTRIAREPLTWMSFVLDLTELKQAEDALKALNQSLEEQVAARTAQLQRQNARLRKLASQLTEAEERERRKLAQTLHDGLQQLLIAGKVQLSLSRSGRAGAIKRAEKFLDEAIAASRSLSYELSPPALRTSDLPKALEWLAAWFQKNHRFNVALTVSNGFPPLPESIKTLLFNAVRELLLNALKHSGSTTASVLLETKQPNYVCIRVADDGKGFDPGKIAPQGEELHGLGLFSIRERLAALGGTFNIEARPGAGARFTLSVSLQEDAQPSEDEVSPPSASPESAYATDFNPERRRTGGGPVRVLLADDHAFFREGLGFFLEDGEDFELVGEAADGVEAVQRADELNPDLVLMDVSMPEMDGIEATRRIKRKHPNILVIGLSFHEDKAMAEAMSKAGASGYFVKGGDVENLVASIRNLV